MSTCGTGRGILKQAASVSSTKGPSPVRHGSNMRKYNNNDEVRINLKNTKEIKGNLNGASVTDIRKHKSALSGL